MSRPFLFFAYWLFLLLIANIFLGCHPERSAPLLGAESKDPRDVSLTSTDTRHSHENVFV
jgi:hypothetical protein